MMDELHPPAVVQMAFDAVAEAEAINDAHTKVVTSVIEECALMADAVRWVEHGDKEAFYDTLWCDKRTAQMMAAVGRHPYFMPRGPAAALSNTNRGSHLPSSWRTLYELSRIDPETLERYHLERLWTAETNRADAEGLVRHYFGEIVEYLFALDRAESKRNEAVQQVDELVVWTDKLPLLEVVPSFDKLRPASNPDDRATQLRLLDQAKANIARWMTATTDAVAVAHKRLTEGVDR